MDCMDPGTAASLTLCLLLAVVVKSLRVHGPGGGAGWRLRQGAVLAMLLVEMSGAQAALYPYLSPKMGLLLSQDHACHQDTQKLLDALRNRTLWAERMVDASARGVVGGLWGNRFQLGSFDGCLSAGLVSPVGARYCLAELSATPRPQPQPLPDAQPHFRSRHRICARPSDRMWDHVTDLDSDSDALDALQGCGIAPDSFPLGEVQVAMCVPHSCGPADLEAALQAALKHSAFEVRVSEDHCTAHDELHAEGDPLRRLFWGVVVALTLVVLLAPHLGWSSWDYRTHGRALVRPDAPLAGLDLNALSGIRTLNTFITVGAHRSLNMSRLPFHSHMGREARTSLGHAPGYHAAVFVDTFFFMSGLLMLLSLAAAPRKQRPLHAIINRYLRLTPSYALVLLFYAFAIESVGSGPLWKSTIALEAAACRRWWFSNLLYVNNYVHGEPGEFGCMLHSWSLALDMQLFVAATLLLPLLPQLLATSRLWMLVVASMLPVFMGTLLNGWPAMFVWSPRTAQNPYADPLFYAMYVRTHVRAIPWVLGVVTGCIMLRMKERNVKLSTVAPLTYGSVLVLIGVVESSVLFGGFPDSPWPPLVRALYASLAPLVWAAALGVLMVALVFGGNDNAIAAVMRWQPLVTLSRFSYGVYLTHFGFQLVHMGAKRTPQWFNEIAVFRHTFGDIAISLLFSIWMYFAVEAPVRHLAKKMLTRFTACGAREDKKKQEHS